MDKIIVAVSRVARRVQIKSIGSVVEADPIFRGFMKEAEQE